jgi:hypothetical protein
LQEKELKENARQVGEEDKEQEQGEEEVGEGQEDQEDVNGFFTYTYEDGTVYEGEFLNGLRYLHSFFFVLVVV